MKHAPPNGIHEEMRPDAISGDGFLGADRRPLRDIIAKDNATVKRLGLTHAGMAEAMIRLRDAGRAGIGAGIRVPPHFEVRVESIRGALPCPFGDEGFFPKTNTCVRNLKSGRDVTFTDLNIHLIEAHGFYEGEGAPFRVDPQTLAEVMEIGSQA